MPYAALSSSRRIDALTPFGVLNVRSSMPEVERSLDGRGGLEGAVEEDMVRDIGMGMRVRGVLILGLLRRWLLV